ncbi:hypothetical protein J2I46_12750 [Fibrella sp. HMF5405]|uniref:Teneurin NHL domain-containing protein n=1 Tax=Fibrella forsythiae TaxID=2817061 RepID=A0ABS3JKN2_9BACT|nr:hypothetical protein [Fibrella forsythiae]
MPATSAQLNEPFGVAVDNKGNLYIAERDNNRIRKVSPSGIITTVAGTGEGGYSGDGGPATCARLNIPFGVTVDSAGNLYIADFGNCRIRKVNTSGIITTVAGTGICGYNGDGGPAAAAQLNHILDVTVDGSGNIYIADRDNHRIRKVNASGIITTVAGTGTYGYSGDGGPATAAQLNTPYSLAVDASGNLYISDSNNHRIRKVNTSGVISTIAGTGGIDDYNGDGGPATAAHLGNTYSILVDGSGNLYIDDFDRCTIRKVSSSGTITTVAGTGTCGYSGDGGLATSTPLTSPFGLAIDKSGNLYIGDHSNNRIRRVSSSGVINSVVGTGTRGSGGYSGDGGPATSAQLNEPYGGVVDGSGNLYIADRNNHRIRKINAARVISTIAGTGNAGYGGDGGPATSASLNSPTGVAVDNSGNLYIADQNNHRIRKVSPLGVTTTVAGTGEAGYSDDGGPATSAQLRSPTGVAVDGNNNLYIADSGNHRIRKVSSSGIITTVAGTSISGYGGDGGLATIAHLNGPTGVAIDGSGNLYIADLGNHRIRKVNTSGIITSIAGTGISGYGGDGGPATSAYLSSPTSVAVGDSGKLYIADLGNHRIRRVNMLGIITTVAGNGNGCDNGDCGLAISARLRSPSGVAVDSSGNLYIADYFDHRIRKVSNTNALMFTLKSGNWTDPRVWSCNRVPVNSDTVQVNHIVSLPTSYVGRVIQVEYGADGRIVLSIGSRLLLGF